MFVTAHGIKTQYQRIGHGPVLVLLHGWGCDWQIWSPIITDLSDSFTLLIPDLPAFGQSHNPTEVWSSSDYVRWLQDFLSQTLKDVPFTLAGHSFGGKIAALYTAQGHLPKPHQLVLIDTSGLPDPLPTRHRVQHQVLALIPESLKAAIPFALKRRLLRATRSADDHFNSTPTQRAILKQIVHEDIADALSKITTPTLVMWGQNDLDTPLHQGRRFAELIPGAELSIFENSGHFPFIDESGTFIQRLQAVLL